VEEDLPHEGAGDVVHGLIEQQLANEQLIDHIATKICELLANRPSLSMAAPQ
jgi:hypothetical protein